MLGWDVKSASYKHQGTNLKVKLSGRVARSSFRLFARRLAAEFVKACSEGEERQDGEVGGDCDGGGDCRQQGGGGVALPPACLGGRLLGSHWQIGARVALHFVICKKQSDLKQPSTSSQCLG